MEKSLVMSPSCICKSPTCLLRGILSEVVSCLFSLFPYYRVDFTQHLFSSKLKSKWIKTCYLGINPEPAQFLSQVVSTFQIVFGFLVNTHSIFYVV